MRSLVNLLTRQLVIPKHRAGKGEQNNLKKLGERKKGEKKYVLS